MLVGEVKGSEMVAVGLTGQMTEWLPWTQRAAFLVLHHGNDQRSYRE